MASLWKARAKRSQSAMAVRASRKISAVTSFEDTVKSRHQKEEAEDLDFLARTENYSGAINQITNFAIKATRRHSDVKHTQTKSELNFQILKNATSISSLDLPLGLDETQHKETRAETDPLGYAYRDSGFSDVTPSTNRSESPQAFSQRTSVTTPPQVSKDGVVSRVSKPFGVKLKSPNFGSSRTKDVHSLDQGNLLNRSGETEDDVDTRSLVSRGSKGIGLPNSDLPVHSLQSYLYTRHYSAFERFKFAKEKFRHAIRLILILLRWVAEITKNSSKHNRFMDQLTTFSEMAQEAYNTEDLRNADLAFDVSYFKANKDINLSNEVKEILSMPPAARTKEQLQTVLFGLQHLRSFAEYPLHMQEKLCKVAWYERVPPRRVIIRQGHTAENFYFILSGKAIVKRAETNPITGEAIIRTAAVMSKGMSFGELALLHHSKRTATVVSHETTQLLTIARRDFMDIFMGGTAPGTIPDHIKFVQSLEFMKDWPIDNLLEHPEYCLFHFFKRGVVVVKDSLRSDWLYVVKSGACQVMKELRAATPSPVCKKTKKIDLTLELPRLGIGEQSPRIDDGRRRSSLPPVPLELKQVMSDYAASIRNMGLQNHDNMSLNITGDNLPRISPDGYQELKKQKTGVSNVQIPDVFQQTALRKTSNKPGYSRSKFNLSQTKRRQLASSPSPDLGLQNETPASGKEQPVSPHTRSPSSKTEKENTPSSVFVQVQLLKPRDVFGLSSVQFDDEIPVSETSVSLVSRGAECIMLSKEFFMRHANEQVRMQLRRHVRPYPTADTFQENLQIQVDWDNYRKELLKDITTQHEVQVSKKSVR